MPTAAEEAAAAAQERAAFDDSGDADDSDGVDSEDTSDDDSAEDTVAAQGTAPPPSQPAVADPSPPPLTGPSSGVDAAVSNPEPVSGPPHSVAVPLNGNGSAAATAVVNEAVDGSIIPVVAEERRPLTLGYDESRRLFQRLWTDDDEIKILQGFLEFTKRRGTTFASHQYDTGPFYEDIKKQLQLEFSKNQLIEKLRRLKKKYRNCVGRMNAAGDGFTFRSTHEKAIFDIARNIWSASVKRSHDSDDDDIHAGATANSSEIFTVPVNEGPLSCDRGFSRSRRRSKRRHIVEAVPLALPPPQPPASAAAAAIAPETTPTAADNSGPPICTPLEAVAGLPSIVEETMKSFLSPLFKELINSAITNPGIGGGAAAAGIMNVLPLGLGNFPMPATGTAMDEKWRAQQILELEVYLKRIEFVRDQVKVTLEDLKSSSS